MAAAVWFDATCVQCTWWRQVRSPIGTCTPALKHRIPPHSSTACVWWVFKRSIMLPVSLGRSLSRSLSLSPSSSALRFVACRYVGAHSVWCDLCAKSAHISMGFVLAILQAVLLFAVLFSKSPCAEMTSPHRSCVPEHKRTSARPCKDHTRNLTCNFLSLSKKR